MSKDASFDTRSQQFNVMRNSSVSGQLCDDNIPAVLDKALQSTGVDV